MNPLRRNRRYLPEGRYRKLPVALTALVCLFAGSLWGQTMLKARLESTKYQGRVGRPLAITIKVSPPSLPSGVFITSSVVVKSWPGGKTPLVVTGYPDISVTPYEPGHYVLEITVNRIYRSSCGGAEADTLLTEAVKLSIAP